jgi:hypothetical protein
MMSKPMPSSARGWWRQLPRLPAGQRDPPPVPELRVHQHRQVSAPAERPAEPVQAGGVVEVTVRADHRLDRVRRELEPAHVLDHAVRADAGVEQQPVHAAVLELDLDQGGEAVLGDRARRRRGRPGAPAPPAGASPAARAAGPGRRRPPARRPCCRSAS